jgi:hypothetical protein
MRATYHDLEMVSWTIEPGSVDRPAQMPLLGLLTGMLLALVLWSGIAALLWALFA